MPGLRSEDLPTNLLLAEAAGGQPASVAVALAALRALPEEANAPEVKGLSILTGVSRVTLEGMP